MQFARPAQIAMPAEQEARGGIRPFTCPPPGRAAPVVCSGSAPNCTEKLRARRHVLNTALDFFTLSCIWIAGQIGFQRDFRVLAAARPK